MKLTLRTELPENFRDHGVFVEDAPEDPTPTSEDAQARAARLTTAKADADARLTALFAKVKAGTVTASEFASLPKLADDVGLLDKELKDAQSAAATAEQRRLRSADAELRAKIETLLADAAKHKKEFAAAYKDACLALGSFCSAVDEATQIEASRTRSRNFGLLDPDRTLASTRIASLTADLDPRLSLAGFSGTVQYGWNLQFPVVPLHYETRKEKL
jgi:hypothetical protein